MTTKKRSLRTMVPPAVSLSHEISTARNLLLETAAYAVGSGHMETAVALSRALDDLRRADVALRADVIERVSR
ncbi:MAG: hypothetical protein WD492_06960 [Alkalispirochaeta sp.]